MRALMTPLAIAVFLTGCAPQSGNYTTITEAQNQQMAEDSVHKIAVLYPAASTHIFLSQATNDAYGKALEKKLRASGYAVQQNEGLDDWLATLSPPPQQESADTSDPKEKPESAETTYQAVPVTPVTNGAKPVAETTHIPVSYIIDPLDSGLYRVSITLDARVLSRVYVLSKKRFGAAGAWALKE